MIRVTPVAYRGLLGLLGLLGASSVALSQNAPPVQPRVQETPVPPAATIPPPRKLPADVPSRPITAQEASLIALKNQPNVTIARANILAAQGRTQQIRAGIMPTVTVTASATNVNTLATEPGGAAAVGTTGTGGAASGGTGTGTGGAGTVSSTPASSAASSLVSPGFVAEVDVRQLLFDFNHTRDQIRQARLLEKVASENLTQVQSDTVFTTKQAYYLFLQNVHLVTVNQQNLANRQSQLDLARARLNTGLGLPSDVVTAETEVSSAVNELSLAQLAATTARVNLALTMGIDPRTPLTPAEAGEPAIATNDMNGLVNTALTRRPEILSAMANLQSAKYGVSAAKTTSAPSFAADLGFNSHAADFPPGNDFASIGISVQWDAFDGGLTGGLVKTARANVTIAQAQITSEQLTVVSDVSQALLNLATSQGRLTTTGIEVANAQEGVRIAEGRFRAGLGQFLDIINAQAELYTAQTDQVSAQYNVDQSKAALLHAIGTPVPAGP